MANEYRVSTLATQVLHSGPAAGPARVSTVRVEVLHSGPAAGPARVSTLTMEVLRSISYVPTSARRRQVVTPNVG